MKGIIVKILSIIVPLGFTAKLWSQETMFGTPFITNYTKNEIGISSINHDIIQDKRGIIYLANDFGILEFDGQNWTIIQNATNGSNIISLAIDKNNRIYAGAQGDIGYLDYHSEYKLIYKSLLDKIPEKYRNFGDVWQTHVAPYGIVYHTWDATFIYTDDTIKVIKFPELTRESFMVRDTVYIQANEGLFYINNFDTVRSPFSDSFNNKDIVFMLPYQGSDFLIGTKSKGVYIVDYKGARPFQIKDDKLLSDYQLKGGILLKNGNYIFLTIQNGILFVDNQGNLINYLSKHNGLQSNRINCVMSDKAGNLWVGSNGVDYVETSSPFSILPVNPEEPHSVYSTIIYKKKLYVATHHGLFRTDWSGPSGFQGNAYSYKRLANLPDIIWNLQMIDDQLFISTQNGFYQLIDDKPVLIAKSEGGWLLKKVKESPYLLLGGTYMGLIWLKKENGKWKFYKKIPGFYESSRIMEQDDDGNIWVCHGYKGTYKLELNTALDSVEKVSFYGQNKGFPSNIYTGVYKIDNNLVFSSQYGFYSYDAKADSMIINNWFAEKIGSSQHVRMLREVKNKIWFIYGETTGYIEKFADGTYTVVTSPFNKLTEHYIPGFENFCFLLDNNAIIGTKSDLIFYNSKIESNSGKPYQGLLRRVECPISNEVIYDDRYEYLCDTLINNDPEINYQNNNVVFHFAASFYENIKDLKFSYYLEGFDKKWSPWVNVNHKEYTNLPEGDYVFRVKAINIYNTESNQVAYYFSILPPWYRKTWAFLVYFIFVIGLVAIMFRIRNRQLQKEKQAFIAEQMKKKALQDAKFNEERLKVELQNKNNELASLASNVIYKNERISEIKLKLEELTPIAADSVKLKLNKVLDFIDKELEDDNWENFEVRFNQAHNNFIKRFKEAYPELTPKDLKFCAYLRMNLSTKEIAQLLNMTIRGVENARYRIRKRAGLESNDNLTEFILTF